MKKTQQTIISIISFIIILIFTESSFAENSCMLTWWTNEGSASECYADLPDPYSPIPVWDCESWTPNIHGSKPTMETSKTQTDALEVFLTIMNKDPQGFSSSNCYYYDYYQSPEDEHSRVCLDGTWSDYYYVGTNAYGYSYNASGGWDVFCDNDNDGVYEDTDNCPNVFNPNQEDADSDTIGNVCDVCPNDALDDVDGDGVCGDTDNCPNVFNPNQEDADSDIIGNVCDNCPSIENFGQEDIDYDGIGDACDDCLDVDADGACDDTDNCPDVANQGQQDVDNNGIGDVCDPNTIYGTISGVIQEGITVNIYIVSCGLPQPHATGITDDQGYYAIGNLGDARYLVAPEDASYSFTSEYWINIPQAEIQSYNFGHLLGGLVTGTVLYGASDYTTFAWPVPDSTISLDNIEFIDVATNTTTSADFTSNTLVLSIENTSIWPNLATSPRIFTFEFEQDIFYAVNLLSSTFSHNIILSYTSNSITLEVPMQLTNPGEIFTVTCELIF